MEKIYTEEQNICQLKRTSKDRIRFLLDFSKSLQIINFDEMQFECSIN